MEGTEAYEMAEDRVIAALGRGVRSVREALSLMGDMSDFRRLQAQLLKDHVEPLQFVLDGMVKHRRETRHGKQS